ncbi:hypothetical protein KRE49_11810 [Elizabethkingia meningoseptica]|uniref:DUF6291 domain-containing protein n=1 Tax=Elizabethkingia meningoseptica TaxID=238 RepID=UPI0023AE9983|nr:DUF6291 domain-containing protein [Elizabethkingia meningoseptica]MDE5516424.1 hypothetical protein [Elizabethkingia meningoseptica]MDE5526669.1 hypothetical protein [Elizabethkingia meningoseptica]MDN4033718.1 hypothetical protein [Elizabethkingia meningoseptica]
MQRDSFIFYRSFYEAIKELPRDIQGEVLTTIMEYGLEGVTTDNLKPVARAIFTLIKPILDANNQRFVNGSKGGRKPSNNQEETENKPKCNQEETKVLPNKEEDVEEEEEVDVDKDGEKKYAPTKPFSKLSKDEFYNSLAEHVGEYSKQTVRDFFDYWTEPSASGKMKFQMEKTWSIPHRLATWKRNEGKFGGVQQAVKPTKKKPYGVWDV